MYQMDKDGYGLIGRRLDFNKNTPLKNTRQKYHISILVITEAQITLQDGKTILALFRYTASIRLWSLI